MRPLPEGPRVSRTASGEIAIKIAAIKVRAALSHAKGRQRLLGSRPVGNRRSKYTMKPNIRIQTQILSHAVTLPPRSGSGCATRAEMGYSGRKGSTAGLYPMGQPSQPIG